MQLPLISVEDVNQITLASPCAASWDDMRGDERIRFCSQCRQHVYNLSEMTAAEAVQAMRQEQRRPCVRFFRRKDGTAISADCQAGWRWQLWRQLRKRMAWVAGFFAWLLLPACVGGNMIQPKNVDVPDNQKKTAEVQSQPAAATDAEVQSQPAGATDNAKGPSNASPAASNP